MHHCGGGGGGGEQSWRPQTQGCIVATLVLEGCLGLG